MAVHSALILFLIMVINGGFFDIKPQINPKTEKRKKQKAPKPIDIKVLELFLMERDTGIEPVSSAWEADVLPIY